MKFIKVFLFFLLCSFEISNATDAHFFAQMGFGLMASKGDFNDHTTEIYDNEKNKGILHPATLKILGTPDFTLGLDLHCFSLGLNFQSWKSNQNLLGFEDPTIERATKIFHIGGEFTYNIFWPEFFQIGVGGGIAYSSIKSEDNLFFGTKTFNTRFNGLQIGAIADIRYGLTDHLFLVSALKIYEGTYWNLEASPLDKDAMDSSYWQTFILITMSVKYQF